MTLASHGSRSRRSSEDTARRDRRAWPVEFDRRADKDLERLDAAVRLRVITAIERLSSEPHSAGLRKLTGRTESRLRVGDWRVIVELDIARRTIVIVLPRGRAYDR